jgi:ubiquinone/menaquinone biosynthesis C-methylase UbiE
VVGVDYVPALLERGRARAAAERLDIDFVEGDAEALPVPDESFDAVVSVYGAMFAPDHHRTAEELVRVTRPGGTIALASWTPEGFLGELFRTVAEHAPPPPGLVPPMRWGSEQHLLGLFGDFVAWRHTRRTFTFRFASAEAFVGTFVRSYGPTLKAVEAAGPALEQDLKTLVHDWNRLPDGGPVAVPGAYLESVGTRA